MFFIRKIINNDYNFQSFFKSISISKKNVITKQNKLQIWFALIDFIDNCIIIVIIQITNFELIVIEHRQPQKVIVFDLIFPKYKFIKKKILNYS